MQSDRLIGHAPRARAFGEKFYETGGTCIGCKGCTGLCQALIEALIVPDSILGREDCRRLFPDLSCTRDNVTSDRMTQALSRACFLGYAL